MIKIDLPKEVNLIISKLENAGYEAYAVGGCVRDSLLNREPNDWDITTSAKPEEVKAVFRRTVDTGIEHGTVTVLMDEGTYEVTTYRIDGEYEDSRHPKQVEFTSNLLEDLKRRDFTINAMAYNDNSGIVDAFGGMEDLEAGIIRCVGKATERFDEDALRIMRAVRFAAQLGYEIEEETKNAAKAMHENLRNISAERINVELTKLIVSPNPGYIRIAYETGILDVILPELSGLMTVTQNNPHHCYTIGEHIIHSVENIENDRCLRLAMLFHDIGKGVAKYTGDDGLDHFHGHPEISGNMTHEIMKRLKYDNDTLHLVEKLVKNHDLYIPTDEKHVRGAMNKLGEGVFPMLMKVKIADIGAQSDYRREEKLIEIEKQKKIYEDIVNRGDCVTLKQLAVTGKDLIENGVEAGPLLGHKLNELLEVVLENPELNTKEELLKRL